MTFETLLIESPSTGVGLIRLNRPHQYNALNTKLLQELAMALEQYEQDDAVSVVIITGSEKHLLRAQIFQKWSVNQAKKCLS